MKLYRSIVLLPLLWWGGDVRAQYSQEPSSMPEQWQLTLDVIKAKAQTLVVKNNGLQDEHRQLIGQLQELQQAITDQQDKNEKTDRFLNQRHGQTDQQAQIDELKQGISTKKNEERDEEGQLEDLRRKQEDLNRKIQQLQDTISGIESRQQEVKQEPQAAQNTPGPSDIDPLASWRKQLEDENRQEVLLENQLGELKNGPQASNLNVDAIEDENKQLEAHLDNLRLQQLRHLRKASGQSLGEANVRKYEQLKKRKDQLEANINAYEFRLDDLRETSLMALSWPLKKKKLIHEMVQTDARNNQIRSKIKVLKEDIDVLKDQVAKLERRVDFVKGKSL